jgi:hypothetical protein
MYLPALHLVQLLPPSAEPVSVVEPALQAAQCQEALEPVILAKRPRSQLEQRMTAEECEYLPFAHLLHSVAPKYGPAFVTDPAVQFRQSLTVETVENSPGAHGVHALDPAALPLLAM